MLLRTVLAATLLSGASSWAQESKPVPANSSSYSDETPLETLAADPAAVAILNKDLPGLLSDAQYPIFKHMSLKSLQEASGGDLSKNDVEKTVAELQTLPPH